MKNVVVKPSPPDEQTPGVTSDHALEATVVVSDGQASGITAMVHADPMIALTLIAVAALAVVGLALRIVSRMVSKR